MKRKLFLALVLLMAFSLLFAVVSFANASALNDFSI